MRRLDCVDREFGSGLRVARQFDAGAAVVEQREARLAQRDAFFDVVVDVEIAAIHVDLLDAASHEHGGRIRRMFEERAACDAQYELATRFCLPVHQLYLAIALS
ncbi:hypothetical protein [Paraburkholderia caribensis]|uniref:hypothetical protein n=1 Tax=Paraburkholderia caribensis TaxID=75105 RepID=UPI001ABBA7EC|nr:hypothetical protein [Paraburkholderia caribensis]